MKFESRIVSTLLRATPALLVTLAYAGAAAGQLPNPSFDLSDCSITPNRTFRYLAGTGPDPSWPPQRIESLSGGDWSVLGGGTCTGAGDSWNCAGLAVVLKGGATVTETEDFVLGTGGSGATDEVLNVQVDGGATPCSADFRFIAASIAEADGWGDPHLTTVDGVHYDFQSAGEFTALREEGFEVQTRQTEVPTATVPITNPYTEITHCVSIYTAVAAKLGSSRVTVQPSPGEVPDPKSMQVRVNGNLITLGDTPYVLHAGGSPKGALEGSIIKRPDGVFEIRDARGTQLFVTPRYWDSRKVWYLNVNVFGTSALLGTMGKLGDRSWLPALPDGSSLGAKPATESERYEVLYEKFADAWRVTKDTSLFDYKGYGAEGGDAKTEDYTLDEWPRNHPQSCAIEGQESAPTATEEVAQQACKNIFNAARRADCVLDVMITGNEGFGKNAEVAQRLTPVALGWYSPVAAKPEPAMECGKSDKCDECKECPPLPWWCWLAVAVAVVLLVLLVLRSRSKK